MDEILLDLTSLKCLVQKPFVDVSNEIKGDIRSVSVSDILQTTDGIAFENIACYISSYILKKMELSCRFCIDIFSIKSIPKLHKSYEFIRQKKYSEQVRFLYPSMKFVRLIEELETLYTKHFSNISHFDNVLSRLTETGKCKTKGRTSCLSEICELKLLYAVILFFKVRIHASLRRTNISNKESNGSRNKKLLKLMHI